MNPIIILLRLILPTSILRRPLVGSIIAIWLDNIDWFNMNFLGYAPIGNYQAVDKVLDTYYLIFLAIIASTFKNLTMRKLLLGLFVYRLIGFVLFEVTQIRSLLFFFPNIFEDLFFIYYILKFLAGYEPKISKRMYVLLLALATFPKMIQEYYEHVVQRPIDISILGIPPAALQKTDSIIFFIVGVAVFTGLWYRHSKKV